MQWSVNILKSLHSREVVVYAVKCDHHQIKSSHRSLLMQSSVTVIKSLTL